MKAGVLQYRQALIVKHCENNVSITESPWCKYGVSRIGTTNIKAIILKRFNRRRDYFDFFAAKISIFPGVGIETAYLDMWMFYAKF